MKCQVCGITTQVNYGNSELVLCNNCYSKGDINGLKLRRDKKSYNKREQSTNDLFSQGAHLFIGLGFILLITSVLSFVSYSYREHSIILFMLGFFIAALGFLIQISRDVREIKEQLKDEREGK